MSSLVLLLVAASTRLSAEGGSFFFSPCFSVERMLIASTVGCKLSFLFRSPYSHSASGHTEGQVNDACGQFQDYCTNIIMHSNKAFERNKNTPERLQQHRRHTASAIRS